MTNEVINRPIGNHKINIAIGVFGMLIACYANFLVPSNLQKLSYLIAAILLFTSSILERQKFFIILQIIIIVGTAIAFTSFSTPLKALFPITLSVLAIIYFFLDGKLHDRLTLLGCLGIILLATGYAITNPIVYFLGSLVLMVYSFISYQRGVTIALVWAILNALFTVTSLVAVYYLVK